MLFRGSDTNISMIVRHADTVFVRPEKREPLWMLNGPRRNVFVATCRIYQRDDFPLNEMRLMAENYVLCNGFDGMGDCGANLYPLKRPAGGFYIPAAGAGTGWATTYWSGGRSTLALLYPGPDGPVATERYEMLREGLELCEAVIFLKNTLAKKRDRLSPDLQQRAERYLREREVAYSHVAFRVRYLQAAEDAKLLALAGEVARELGKK
jgi:hypothetical protein